MQDNGHQNNRRKIIHLTWFVINIPSGSRPITEGNLLRAIGSIKVKSQSFLTSNMNITFRSIYVRVMGANIWYSDNESHD